MNDAIKQFLLVFDQGVGRLISVEEFGADEDAAIVAYGSAEALYRDRREIEVVLLGSDSLDTVKLTHANYFERTTAPSKYLAGI